MAKTIQRTRLQNTTRTAVIITATARRVISGLETPSATMGMSVWTLTWRLSPRPSAAPGSRCW